MYQFQSTYVAIYSTFFYEKKTFLVITLITLKIDINVYFKEHINMFVSLGTQRDAKTTKDCIQVQVSVLMHVVCVCV
jgi:hypothetical protein